MRGRNHLILTQGIARFVLAALLLVPLHADNAPKPNIILIMADDLSTRLVSWQNPKVKTHHLDRLAKAGVRLLRLGATGN